MVLRNFNVVLIKNYEGGIRPRYVDSLSRLEPENCVVFSRRMVASKCGWSPFEGYESLGKVKGIVIRGVPFVKG